MNRHVTTIFPKYFFCLLVLVLLSTCITPVDVEPSDFEESLVIQGFIDDDYGPHNIRITRVTKFAGVLDGGVFVIIEGATVSIIDQNEKSVPLERALTRTKETRGGALCQVGFVEILTDYRTPETFKGEIGSTYVLEIITKEGETYRSEPQTILPTPRIDSLSLTFKELPSLDPVVPESGVEVNVTWQDPVEEGNQYFWRVNGIYKIFTPPFSSRECCPYDRDGGAFDCWILEKNIDGNELAFSDQQVNGQNVTLQVGLVIDDGLRFGNEKVSAQRQYYIEVEQYMIPDEAFDFNRRVKILQGINGEIFDPPPLSVRGNIFNINDREENVLGFFGAYAKQTKGIFVPRSLLKFVKRFPKPCGDCRTRGGAQVETPEPYRN